MVLQDLSSVKMANPCVGCFNLSEKVKCGITITVFAVSLLTLTIALIASLASTHTLTPIAPGYSFGKIGQFFSGVLLTGGTISTLVSGLLMFNKISAYRAQKNKLLM